MALLVLCDDMIFASRISGTARARGVECKVASSQWQLEAMSAQAAPKCVIVDLSHPGLVLTTLIQSLGETGPMPFLVGYGSHVDTATLKAARVAGCDLVLPRSKFVEVLPVELADWMKRPG